MLCQDLPFCLGCFFVLPEFRAVFLKGGVGVGDLGLFLVVSYVAGHLVAAVGNVLESVWWRFRGGWPSQWILRKDQKILAPAQVTKLEARIRGRLGLPSVMLAGMEPGQWQSVFRQITTEVAREGRDARAEIFNGNYGMNRGIASAFLMVALFNVSASWTDWQTTILSALLALLALTRMDRFGGHYARTMIMEFLQLPETDKDRAKVGLS